MAMTWHQSVRYAATSALSIILTAAAFVIYLTSRSADEPRQLFSPQVHPVSSITPEDPTIEATSDAIVLPEESWKAAAIELKRVECKPLAMSVELTGKIALNEDHIAHIFPLVDGRVEEVKVQFGDRVQRGQELVVVQSKEVGQAMLQLYQDRLHRDFAITKDRWNQEVAKNTQEMLQHIRDHLDVDELEKRMANKPMGEFRQRLMSAYINQYRSEKHFERLSPLTAEGVVTGRQLLEAETERDAARATVQSLIEQTQQDVMQAAVVSQQTVKDLQTRVAVDETTLEILGIDAAAIQQVDPARQGESLSHYPIYAPFDGTVISKDVVLLEHVGPDRQILSIADLSTVWVTTNIYEEHLPLLKDVGHKKIYLRNKAWPDRTFEAEIFYTGDVVDETSRTVSMRALADNRDGLLKPGMFVNVELPENNPDKVIQVPVASLQEHQGKQFVFVHLEGDQFARRDIAVGRSNGQSIEILAGLESNDEVVVRGGFALKSRMLAELLSE